MITSINNLGILRKGIFDFSKKISIFTGINNTGKTYTSYIIHALCSMRVMPKHELSSMLNRSDLISRKSVELAIDLDLFSKILNKNVSYVKNKLNSVFGISEESANELFSDLNIDFSQVLSMADIVKDLEIEHTAYFNGAKVEFVKNRARHSFSINLHEAPIEQFKENIDTLATMIIAVMYTVLLHSLIPQAVIFPVERIAIPTFKTELSIRRNNLIHSMLELSDRPDADVAITDILTRNSTRYPEAIRYSLELASDLAELQKKKSAYYDLAREIENELLHGEVSADAKGDVVFTHSRAQKTLPVHISASIVKSFANIIFYLKHLAVRNQLVIIDEPEMNLHPEGQRIFVRIMAKLCQSGLKFLISTHSDYIVKEVSNMLLENNHTQAHSAGELTERDVAVYDFSFTESECVDMVSVPFGEYGYEIASLNDTIDAQNAQFDEILEQGYLDDEDVR